MFRKIVSSLPFNPGLIHQLTFYAKRLHQEESVRRIGVIFTILALGVQLVAVLSPAQTTLATSTNDITYGADSKQDIINAVSSGIDAKGRGDIRQIYDYYGITLDDVQAASVTTVKSRERQYVTTGRGDSPGVDTPVQIPGTGSTIYERSLNVWDIRNYENCYRAITGTATGNGLLRGRQFWVLLGNCGASGGCGNITFEPVPKNPKLEMVKTVVGSGTYRVNDVMNFKIEFRNPGDAAVTSPVLDDMLAPEFEFIEQTSSLGVDFSQQGQYLVWRFGDIEPSQTWHSILVKVRMRSIPNAKKVVCNASKFSTGNIGDVWSTNPEAQRCLTIDNTCPGTDLPMPANGQCTYTCPDGTVVNYDQQGTCQTPTATCEYLKIIDKPAWNKRTFEVKFSLSPGAGLTNAWLTVEGGKVKDLGSTDTTKTFTYEHTFSNQGSFTTKAHATPNRITDFTNGAGCEVTETLVEPYTRISLEKGVSNITQNIVDANNTIAKAGDELEYTLSVSNSGNTAADNYIIDSDVLTDILEYADLLNYEGASYDSTHQRLTWPTATIPANGTVTKKFRAKVKSPIPTTPPSTSDPLSFDYKLRNVFGNEVVVSVDKPIPGQVYEVVTSIPNTGPGSSLIVSLIAALVIGYFYARSRLLAKEVEIIKNEELAGA